MKYAIISDIHCNYLMLEQCINDAIANNVQKFIFLGDYVTDGYSGDMVISLLKKLSEKYPCEFIYGNREKYIKSYHDMSDEFNERFNRKALGYESLSSESLQWINGLEETKYLSIDGLKILLIHGDSFNEQIDITYNYEMLLERFDFDVCLFGHTHILRNDTFKGKRFINPGSVSYSKKEGMSYCIIDVMDKNVKCEHRIIKADYKIIELFRNFFIQTGFYQSNQIWTELLLNWVRDNVNYTSLFMVFLRETIPNINTISSGEYNFLYQEKYEEFAEKYHLDRISERKPKRM